MIAACALLAGAVAAGWLVPRVLARMDLRRRDPLPLIVAWLVSTAGVLVAAASGVSLLLLPDHGPGPALLTAVHRCWSAIQHGSPPRVEEVRGAPWRVTCTRAVWTAPWPWPRTLWTSASPGYSTTRVHRVPCHEPSHVD
jgi:hypothetical protein